LKQKVLEGDFDENKFIPIKAEFFKGANKTVLKTIGTNKNLKAIVEFVHAIINFVLCKDTLPITLE